jgi:ubiquinone/menaquinone biosynthesis C-methylase UbiE
MNIEDDNKKQQYFDWLAPLYDEATERIGWFPNLELEKVINKYLSKGSKVIDIGIGTGQTASVFLSKGCSVIGTDISKKMLEEVHKKFPNIDLYQIDITAEKQTLFGDREFDAVSCIGTFEFISNPNIFFNFNKKVLKEGGLLFFSYEKLVKNSILQTEKVSKLSSEKSDFLPDTSFLVYRYSEDEINNILKKYSFEIKDQIDFIGYYKGVEKIPVKYGLVIAQLLSH